MTDGYDPPGGNPPLPDPASPSGEGSGYPPQGGEAPPPGDDRGKGLAIAGGAALVIALIVVVILLATNSSSKKTPTVTQSLSVGHTTNLPSRRR